MGRRPGGVGRARVGGLGAGSVRSSPSSTSYAHRFTLASSAERRHPNNGLEYIQHLPKTLTVPHLHELTLAFPDAMRAASLRKFREQRTGGADVRPLSPYALSTHLALAPAL